MPEVGQEPADFSGSVARSRRTVVYHFGTRNQEPSKWQKIRRARAPRGTRTVAQAFFQAVDEIPEDRRAEVVKAALGLIRDQIKEAREKARAAKQKRAGAKQAAKKQSAKKACTTQTGETGSITQARRTSAGRADTGGRWRLTRPVTGRGCIILIIE